jgi:hypothetical protein
LRGDGLRERRHDVVGDQREARRAGDEAGVPRGRVLGREQLDQAVADSLLDAGRALDEEQAVGAAMGPTRQTARTRDPRVARRPDDVGDGGRTG